MSGEIEVTGGRIWFQGHKVAAIYKDIPASTRDEFVEKLLNLDNESIFEDE